ncbi:MAG: 30S ribosomal protein S6 [Candidatus Omnitrophica bacterium]|nr:30S ribosomal protein S6 [Candidatus Omnitrophota bacterium]
MMRTGTYEALVILKTAGSEQDVAKRAAALEEPIKKSGGTIATSHPIGRRRLAFRIARHAEGHYHLLRFSLPAERLADLERLYRLNDAVVRFMILNAEELGATADGITTYTPASSRSSYASSRGPATSEV